MRKPARCVRGTPGRRPRSVWASLLAIGLCLVQPPSNVAAQLAEPCQLTCAAVLGATGFVAATGVAIAVGRASGGMSSVNQGLRVWGGTLALVVGGGLALAGDGDRQERAIYSAGLGTMAGALAGLSLEAVRTGGDGTRVLAGALVGAAAGAVLGGVYGALSHDPDGPQSLPLFNVSLPF